MRRAFDARLYYPALLVALTIPDICAGLAMDDTTYVNEKTYVAFVDKYTVLSGHDPNGIGIDGLGCFRLRGGVVHRANAAGHPHYGATHAIFCLPETDGGMHALSLVAGDKTADMFVLDQFCRGMDHAARKWLAEHKDHPTVKANMPRLLSLRPNGVAPFFVGAPVVASGSN